MLPPAHPDILAKMGSTAGRTHRAIRQLRHSPTTWRLVRILILIQTIPALWDFLHPTAYKLILAQKTLGLTSSPTFWHTPWQLLTHGLIHASWLHLLANTACILLLGSKLEHIIPARSYSLLCLLSTLTGGTLFLLLSPSSTHLHSPQILVGSSATCFGLLTLLTTLSPGSRFLPLLLSGKTIGIAILLSTLTLTLLNPDLPTGPLATLGGKLTHTLPNLFQVSHACHLGGSLTGILYGKWLLRPPISLRSLQRARAKNEAK